MKELYSKKVMDHFFNPRNMGEITNPDAAVRVGNPVCGDIMEMYLKVGQREATGGETEEYIEDIKFKTLGCGAAIATSSMATELIKGKSLAEAEKLTNKVLSEALNGLPPVKEHCSMLATEAVKKAINKYRNSRNDHSRD